MLQYSTITWLKTANVIEKHILICCSKWPSLVPLCLALRSPTIFHSSFHCFLNMRQYRRQLLVRVYLPQSALITLCILRWKWSKETQARKLFLFLLLWIFELIWAKDILEQATNRKQSALISLYNMIKVMERDAFLTAHHEIASTIRLLLSNLGQSTLGTFNWH